MTSVEIVPARRGRRSSRGKLQACVATLIVDHDRVAPYSVRKLDNEHN